MATRPTTLSLENLESRLNLSTLTGHLPTAAFGIHSQERALFKSRTKLISLRDGTSRDFVGQRAPAGALPKSLAEPLVSKTGIDSPAPSVNVTSTTKAITITWVNDSVNAIGFRVERSTDGTTFKTIGTAPANKTTFIDKTAVGGIQYVYRVTAFNKIDSTSSNTSTTVSLIPPRRPLRLPRSSMPRAPIRPSRFPGRTTPPPKPVITSTAPSMDKPIPSSPASRPIPNRLPTPSSPPEQPTTMNLPPGTPAANPLPPSPSPPPLLVQLLPRLPLPPSPMSPAMASL